MKCFNKLLISFTNKQIDKSNFETTSIYSQSETESLMVTMVMLGLPSLPPTGKLKKSSNVSGPSSRGRLASSTIVTGNVLAISPGEKSIILETGW